jgi:hypothetical protein
MRAEGSDSTFVLKRTFVLRFPSLR